jgi:hypothetical protein
VIQLPASQDVNRKAMLWLGLSQPALSQWKTIGENADELITNGNKLPNAYRRRTFNY